MDIQKVTTVLEGLSYAKGLGEVKNLLVVEPAVLEFLDDLDIYGLDALDEEKKIKSQLEATLWVTEYYRRLKTGIDTSDLDGDIERLDENLKLENEKENEIKTLAFMLHADLELLLLSDDSVKLSGIQAHAEYLLELLGSFGKK